MMKPASAGFFMAGEMRQAMARKLERDEFARMLANGRGLAMMHVQEHGLWDVLDLVIAGCVTAQAYDPQCEVQRAPWLYRMIRHSPQLDQIVAAIGAALPQSDEMWDIVQMCDLAALLAADGDALAGATLRSFVLGQDFSQDTQKHGCDALVKLDGMPAVELLARRFGALILRDPQVWPETVADITYGVMDEAETLAALEKSAENDAELAAYVRYCKGEIEKKKAYNTEASVEERRLKASAERVLAAAETDTRLNKGFYRAFGRFATDDELEQALQKLLVSVEPAVCTRLLWIFNAVRMPRMDAKLFELARHSDPELRYAAIHALSAFSDPAVKRLGIDMLESLSIDDGHILKLFIKNFSAGDELVIPASLEKLAPSGDEVHAFETSMVDIFQENDGPPAAILAGWLYEASACSVCRRRAVARLAELAMLPEDIAQECLFDADPATQLAARGEKNKGPEGPLKTS
jgi:hypothetical protein